jgi:hypothetical protein
MPPQSFFKTRNVPETWFFYKVFQQLTDIILEAIPARLPVES